MTPALGFVSDLGHTPRHLPWQQGRTMTEEDNLSVCGLCTAHSKMMMIEIVKVTRTELENKNFKVLGETFEGELGSEHGSGHVQKGLPKHQRRQSKDTGHLVRTTSLLLRRGPSGNSELAAKFTIKGEGHVQDDRHFPGFKHRFRQISRWHVLTLF